MALVLSLQKGESVYIDDQQMVVEKIFDPTRFRVKVIGTAMDHVYDVSDALRTEIIPGVFLSAGDTGNYDKVKAVFEAPRNRSILREQLYKEGKGGRTD